MVEHMEYLKMSQKEINEIIRKGGAELSELNKLVNKHLEGLELSKYSRIASARQM